MSTTRKRAADEVHPIVAKAAAGVRKCRTRTTAPIPFAPTPGQLELELFTPTELEDQP
ncbi:hypothetical protein [Nocardia asteroides]|uniref:hypothetical protein n=1 Tax=Nocardia asteroides TaxID=1824 RepID=UPI001E3D1A04|nr:hypothetical protein [Nocardia asteroides]UGT63405.1 hypothetical protein LTT61_08865 [Nocardia asteroides]